MRCNYGFLKATSVAFGLLSLALIMPCISFAQTQPIGAPELKLVETFLTGNFGFFIGLATAFYGVYKIGAKADARGGTLLIIIGVLFTLIPTIYNGTRLVVCPIAKAIASTAACD